MSSESTSEERILVILPAYNEAGNVVELSGLVLAEDPRIEVLVVDDNSPDGTGDLVERAQETEPRLHLLRRPGKLGLGTAYLSGFRFGLDRGFHFIFTMDCDFSHNPKYLPALIALLDDRDMVVGSRYVPGGGIENWPWHRRLLSKFANFYARTLLRVDVHDCTAGYRGYRRKVLETVHPFEIRSSGYSFLEEMAWRVTRYGFSIGEVPIIFEQRVAGVSKIEGAEIYLAAWYVLLTAFRPPKLPGLGQERGPEGGD
ncbi:MAG: polyprenol monophosphomannose synthase [Myxococcota bacterium]|nr:polyprenol monophosphomannose synthase [Myxococcota bacterium]